MSEDDVRSRHVFSESVVLRTVSRDSAHHLYAALHWVQAKQRNSEERNHLQFEFCKLILLKQRAEEPKPHSGNHVKCKYVTNQSQLNALSAGKNKLSMPSAEKS